MYIILAKLDSTYYYSVLALLHDIFPNFSTKLVAVQDVMGRPVMIARAKHFDSQTSVPWYMTYPVENHQFY